MSLLAVLLVFLLAPLLASAQEKPEKPGTTEEPGEAEEVGRTEEDNAAGKARIRFRPIDIFLDTRDAKLAAYQVEVSYDSSRVKIVGVEGADAGEAEGFNPPPYYDRRGVDAGRIVIAAFVTDDALAPAGRTRVATLHLRVEGEREGDMSIRLVTAARPGGERIEPEVELVARKVEKPNEAPKGAQIAATRRAGADDTVLTKPDPGPLKRANVVSSFPKAREAEGKKKDQEGQKIKEGSER